MAQPIVRVGGCRASRCGAGRQSGSRGCFRRSRSRWTIVPARYPTPPRGLWQTLFDGVETGRAGAHTALDARHLDREAGTRAMLVKWAEGSRCIQGKGQRRPCVLCLKSEPEHPAGGDRACSRWGSLTSPLCATPHQPFPRETSYRKPSALAKPPSGQRVSTRGHLTFRSMA